MVSAILNSVKQPGHLYVTILSERINFVQMAYQTQIITTTKAFHIKNITFKPQLSHLTMCNFLHLMLSC